MGSFAAGGFGVEQVVESNGRPGAGCGESDEIEMFLRLEHASLIVAMEDPKVAQ